MDRIVIAHAHIFKNAGTTIDWILQRNFGKKFRDDRNDHIIRKDESYVAAFLQKNKKLKAFSSHSLPLPVRSVSGVDFQVICMLRHPILRVRSVYDFERKQDANTPGALFAKNATFKEYVEWRMLPNVGATIRDMQVNFLTSNVGRALDEGGRLEVAKEYIESIPLLGIVEMFDESMVLFEDCLLKMGVEFNSAYIKQNITEKKRQSNDSKLTQLKSDLGDQLYKRLMDNNQLDISLYNCAVELLQRRLTGVEELSERLEVLLHACAKLR